MADEIETVLYQWAEARDSYTALLDMYPEAHQQVRDAQTLMATLKARLIAEAIVAERQRCHDIVMAARMHEIETDLRSVLSFIERGDSIEDLKKWSGRS